MKKIRIGNDIRVTWTITRNGQAEPLTGRDISVYLVRKLDNVRYPFDYYLHDNVVVGNFYGKDQKATGEYYIILTENAGKVDMHTIDHAEAFRIVEASSKADSTAQDCSNIVVEVVELSDDLDYAKDGLSAYEIAVLHGYQGTEEEWINWLEGGSAKADQALAEISDLSDEMELRLATKQDKLTAGTGIAISNDNVISSTIDANPFVVVSELPYNFVASDDFGNLTSETNDAGINADGSIHEDNYPGQVLAVYDISARGDMNAIYSRYLILLDNHTYFNIAFYTSDDVFISGVRASSESQSQFPAYVSIPIDASIVKIVWWQDSPDLIYFGQLTPSGRTDKIYIVPNPEGGEDNVYNEYVLVNGAYEKIGEFKPDVDISGKADKTDIKTYIADITVDSLLQGSLSTETIATLIALRQDAESNNKLILFKAQEGSVGTLVPVTIIQYGSMFQMYLYYNGRNIYVTADHNNANWTVTITPFYSKPNAGIPKSDLATAVQNSLNKADSALQRESVFVAIYGSTTYASVSSAISANKAVACLFNGDVAWMSSHNANEVRFNLLSSNTLYVITLQRVGSSWSIVGNPMFDIVVSQQVDNQKTKLSINGTDYTIVDGEEPLGSSQTFVAPSWDAMKGYAERADNKVTTLSSQSTDAQYPSAKCVYDEIGPIDDLLDDILGDVDAALDDVLGGDIIPMQEKTMVEEASDTTLDAQVGKYYRFDEEVETLAVTLNHTDEAVVQTIVFSMTIGTTPAVTFTTAESGEDIYYADGFALESGKTYEVNALWNGANWMIASVTLILPTP